MLQSMGLQRAGHDSLTEQHNNHDVILNFGASVNVLIG